MNTKRKYITLIELILVMAILSLVTGLVGINIRKMMQEQNFEREVSQVVEELRLAQDLMLIVGHDAHVVFQKNSSRISMGMALDKLLPGTWDKELKRKKSVLKAIQGISFQEKSLPENGSLVLNFLSDGLVMSQGLLKLSSSSNPNEKGALTRYITLSGYPNAIESSLKPLVEKKDNVPDKLTFLIQREINEKKSNTK